MPKEFVPIPPPGFDIAGTFNGVTTAVGQGGVPHIRYQLTKTEFRSGGVAGWLARRVLAAGVGDEVALVKLPDGLVEILVTESDSEQQARELAIAAMAPYR